MATRAEIRAKYGITRLEPPSIANEELTEEDAKLYENMVRYLAESAHHAFDRQPKEQRLVELVKLYVSDLTDEQLEKSLKFFEKLDKELGGI